MARRYGGGRRFSKPRPAKKTSKPAAKRRPAAARPAGPAPSRRRRQRWDRQVPVVMRRGPWRRGRHLGGRSDGAAYGLALLGFVGLAGLHRFYLGRPLTGLLWLFTGGLCMLGTVADLLFMPGLLRDANQGD